MVAEGETVTLREHLEALEAVRWAAHHDAHDAQETALARADETMTIRLEGMNEFRRQLDRERGSYVTGDRMEDKIAPLIARLDLLERAQSNMSGRFTAATIALGLVVVVVNVALKFIH